MSDEFSLTIKWQNGEITTEEYWRRMERFREREDDEEDRETLRRKTWWPKEP